MISTINVSIPRQLKAWGDNVVSEGHYASFSDLVRTALRNLYIEFLDQRLKETRRDMKNGKAIVLKNEEDIEKFIKSL